MMESPSSGSESDTNPGGGGGFTNYENPNYRKLYATLSVTTMMGRDKKQSDDDVTENDLNDRRTVGEPRNNSGANALPDGWEVHEDDCGAYYWHISSGTIQREKPGDGGGSSNKRDSMIYLQEECGEQPKNRLHHHQQQQMKASPSMELPSPDAGHEHQFLVHSLGWLEFDSDQLTPELSSKAVQRCILELSTRGEGAARAFGKSDTQQLVLKVENSHLKLLHSPSGNLLSLQPIQSVRVWGVNDNNDFAFVARDPAPPMLDSSRAMAEAALGSPTSPTSVPAFSPPILKCHVFHCEEDGGAQTIATLLRDELIRIRSRQEGLVDRSRTSGGSSRPMRPQHLYIDESCTSPITSPDVEFPTPSEEPRKTILSRYLGSVAVGKPAGIGVLNEALLTVVQRNADRAAANGRVEANGDEGECQMALLDGYKSDLVALVHISPSTISVESSVNGELLLECRVRYLSFLGISRENVKHCGFIMQLDKTTFEAHCFECEPSSGALCKTIEAACKLRYQKCLDAHRQRCNLSTGGGDGKSSLTAAGAASSAFTSTLKNVFSKLRLK